MIIFNTTFHMDEDVHDACLQYLIKEYIPSATASGILYSPVLAQVLVQYEECGRSYSLQLRVKDKETLDTWVNTEGGALQENLVTKFGNKVAVFVTLLKRIKLQTN